MLALTGGSGNRPTGAAPNNGLLGDAERGEDPWIIGDKGGGALEVREGGPMGPSVLGLTGDPDDEGILKEETGSGGASDQGAIRNFDDTSDEVILVEDCD